MKYGEIKQNEVKKAQEMARKTIGEIAEYGGNMSMLDDVLCSLIAYRDQMADVGVVNPAYISGTPGLVNSERFAFYR